MTDPSGGPDVPPVVEPLQGVADLHLHMFAEEAFGGGWFHGSHAGPPQEALSPCDGGVPGDHARLREELAPLLQTCDGITLEELGQMVPLVDGLARGGGIGVSEYIGTVPGTDGDTGLHEDRTTGFPDFAGWPAWDTIAHQQVWEEQLREAYDEGLRLTIISADSFDWLCKALPDQNVTRPQCNEMDDVIVQLELANAWAADHDWVEIALTPQDARRIVSEDRLAFVLAVETSHLMADGDWRPQLDALYDLGVRTLQPVHQLDNRFGGAAPHNPIFHVALYSENCHIDDDCGITTPSLTLGFDVDENCRNVLGLTDEGRELVQTMIDRGMLVDVAHLSEKGVRDMFDISVANDFYPIYISHGHFREIMTPGKGREEKTTPAWVVDILRQTGGMMGLRTTHLETNTYSRSEVSNTCHGSSRSFAQVYDFGRLGLKVKMGLGSDLNGFIQQSRPRFGETACSASFSAEATCQVRDELASGAPRLGTAFDEAGLGHAGLIIDLLDDLDLLGSDTGQLRQSANDFVLMWERATGDRSGPAESTEDLDVSGVVIEPPHGERYDALPPECTQE